MLWLLASDHMEGVIDADPKKLAFRLRMSVEEVASALKPLIDNGFFDVQHDDSTLLADCLRDAVPETETETETETEAPPRKRSARPPGKPMASVDELVAAGFPEEVANEFIAHKAGVKAPLTDRAWHDHKAEAEKAGWTPLQAAEKVMAKNWKGFEAKYVVGERPQASPTAQPIAGAI